MKRKVGLITVVLMVLALAITAYAMTPRWSHLTAISAGLDIVDGIAEVYVMCDASNSEVTKVKAKCELQKYDTSWSTVKTWTETESGTIVSYDKTYAVSTDYTYRLKVTGYAYNGSTLLESATEYFD